MKPRVKLAEAETTGRGRLALYEHDGVFSMNFSGQELMHSDACASERFLGRLGIDRVSHEEDALVLIGGLGLGITLLSVLELAGPKTKVCVAELIPEVVEWNRTFLKGINGNSLRDPRVEVRVEDVGPLIRKAERGTYDVILLDVDNGPVAMVAAKNGSLYSNTGLRSIHAALKPGGRAVFWSAGPDRGFEMKLERARFRVDAVPAKVHERAKRAAYVLYVADKM